MVLDRLPVGRKRTAGFEDCAPQAVLELMREYEVSARLTFSNSLLKKEHLSDKKCNTLCAMFENSGEVKMV